MIKEVTISVLAILSLCCLLIYAHYQDKRNHSIPLQLPMKESVKHSPKNVVDKEHVIDKNSFEYRSKRTE